MHFPCSFIHHGPSVSSTDRNRPPWPGTIATTAMSSLRTGGPGKERRIDKLPPTGRIRERAKGERRCPSTGPTKSRNPSRGIHLGRVMHAPPRILKDPESERLARDNPETHPITIKPETTSHGAEQFSGVPSPSCSPPGRPFPIKSLALSARVSPRTIHF